MRLATFATSLLVMILSVLNIGLNCLDIVDFEKACDMNLKDFVLCSKECILKELIHWMTACISKCKHGGFCFVLKRKEYIGWMRNCIKMNSNM